MDLDTLVSIATLIGIAFAAAGLFYTAVQLRHSVRTTQGDFLLRLDELADRYSDSYYRLRGPYDTNQELPPDYFSDEELLEIKEYMGFLEHTEVLIQKKSLDASTFKDLFGHRVAALAANRQVMSATIQADPERWVQFQSLMRRLGIKLQTGIRNKEHGNEPLNPHALNPSMVSSHP